MAGFGSAAFFLSTVCIPSCGSVYAVALFSWISSCSSVGCENIRQETSAAGSLRSLVHLAAQPLHVPPSCVSALRSSVDRVRCEQVDATRREHGYYPASSLRVALLRLNTPDSTSSGPLCFEQGCNYAARGMSICLWLALSPPFPSPAALSRLVRLLFWHREPRGSGAFGLLRPSPPERRAHLGRTSWCRGRLRLRIEPAQADPTAPPASQRAARASWPAGAGWK